VESFTNYKDLEKYLENLTYLLTSDRPSLIVTYKDLARVMFFTNEGQITVNHNLSLSWKMGDYNITVEKKLIS
jgi:hypothetical protein